MASDGIELVFDVVGNQLPQAGIEFLMVGGHAVNQYGYSRATIDVDFMITATDLDAVRAVMKRAGFTNVSQSENVVFFSKPGLPVRVDFLQVDEGTLYKNLLHIHGRNAVVTLDIAGDDKGKHHVLVQEIQKDPVVERLLHVDFLEIELDKPVEFNVSLRLTGVAQGVDLGGLLQVSRDMITLRGCPLDMPDEIVADITELERGGKGISCADLEIPANIEMLDDPATRCVAVI